MAYDWTDHVWTEVYSLALGRWVHADCGEKAFDNPFLYETGWKKELTYIVAVGRHCVVDVSRRYTLDWPGMQARRTLVPEQWYTMPREFINLAVAFLIPYDFCFATPAYL
jgi:peptide-N4-(N-acetyl-beta-glucosaminyl)asparagine amidase